MSSIVKFLLKCNVYLLLWYIKVINVCSFACDKENILYVCYFIYLGSWMSTNFIDTMGDVPLCVGGSKEKAGIQIWRIPVKRDTNKLYPGKINLWYKPAIDATAYIDTTWQILIVGLNLLVFAR